MMILVDSFNELDVHFITDRLLDYWSRHDFTVLYFQAARTCGYDRGVLHVELILKSNDDIALIEINGRLNGT